MEASCAVNVSMEIVTYICVVEISTDYPSISRDQSETLKLRKARKKMFRSFQGTTARPLLKQHHYETQGRFRSVVVVGFSVRE